MPCAHVVRSELHGRSYSSPASSTRPRGARGPQAVVRGREIGLETQGLLVFRQCFRITAELGRPSRDSECARALRGCRVPFRSTCCRIRSPGCGAPSATPRSHQRTSAGMARRRPSRSARARPARRRRERQVHAMLGHGLGGQGRMLELAPVSKEPGPRNRERAAAPERPRGEDEQRDQQERRHDLRGL